MRCSSLLWPLVDKSRKSVTHCQCDARPAVTFPAAGHHSPGVICTLCVLVLFVDRWKDETTAAAAETSTTNETRRGPVQRPSLSGADVTVRSKAWKQFMSTFSSAPNK